MLEMELVMLEMDVVMEVGMEVVQHLLQVLKVQHHLHHLLQALEVLLWL